MRRFLIMAISAVTGVCFAVLAGLSISEMIFPVRGFHVFSVVAAAVSVCLAYLAFRAAIAGQTSAEALATSLLGGMLGALLGLILIVALLLMFRSDLQALFAHALGKRASLFTEYRLLAGFVLLGFGTGFVVRVPAPRARRAVGALR